MKFKYCGFGRITECPIGFEPKIVEWPENAPSWIKKIKAYTCVMHRDFVVTCNKTGLLISYGKQNRRNSINAAVKKLNDKGKKEYLSAVKNALNSH